MDLLKNCLKCRGTGELEGIGGDPPSECDRCGGIGRLDRGEIGNGTKTLDERMTDLEDKANDIMDKVNDIFEKVSE